jgi:hypothetical protein
MFATLSFEYPFWFVGLCVLTGLGYALALYWRDNRFHEKSPRNNRILGTLRFLAVTLLCLLLLSPTLRSKIVDVRKPVVVIAQDQSESLRGALGIDSVQYVAAMERLRENLAQDYDVRTFAFGSSVREGVDYRFSDKSTNISAALEGIYDLYANQNLGAVVLATDGIYNEGSHPAYSGTALGVPVYGVALGDTVQKKDLYLKKVFNNRIAYLGDKFTLEADVAAFNLSGQATRLTVSKIEGERIVPLQTKDISLDKTDFFQTQEILLDATQPGVQRFRITLSGVSAEATLANNTRDIFVEVLDARQKILLLANAPHPDLSAIKQVLLGQQNYAVDIRYPKNDPVDVAQYDFVVLHQIPGSNTTADAALNVIRSKKIPRLFILGAQSNLAAFNQQQSLLNVQGNIAQTNMVDPRIMKAFPLFNLEEPVLKNTNQFPPLVVPFGEFTVTGNASVLLTQKIGAVETNYPLLLMGDEPTGKTGVLAGEGVYRWRLFDYLQRDNFAVFDELLGKTIQYLALKDDKRRFRVYTAQNVFNENESIRLDAELYNASYELINDPDASIVVTDEQGRKFNFTFNKNGRAYQLNAGYFPVGNYTYEAQATVNGEVLKADGRFAVQPVQLEQYATTADHNLLRVLSAQYGGRVVYPAQLDALAEQLRNENKLPAIRYESTSTRSVINLKWIFFLLLGLLSGEWLLRRYWGSY